jgi:hypothetical protein
MSTFLLFKFGWRRMTESPLPVESLEKRERSLGVTGKGDDGAVDWEEGKEGRLALADGFLSLPDRRTPVIIAEVG